MKDTRKINPINPFIEERKLIRNEIFFNVDKPQNYPWKNILDERLIM